MAISLGTYMKGELPKPLAYSYLDDAGTAIDITGYTVAAVVQSPDGVRTEVSGTVSNGATGTIALSWTSDMTDAVGPWSMTLWAGNGSTVKLASPVIAYNVADDTAPSV